MLNSSSLTNLAENLPKPHLVKTEILRRKQHIFPLWPRQQEFANLVDIFTVKKRTIIATYGGAMGPGKTWLHIFLFIELALMYPKSKWTILRESLQRCKETVEDDLKEIGQGLYKRYYESSQTGHYMLFHNGSKIELKGENIDKDKDLDSFKSYKTNGFFLEQLEEITEEMFEMAIMRTGRNVINPMPPRLVLTSINPTNTWARDRIYEKWKKGMLPQDYIYLPATVKDNPVLYNDEAYMSKFDNVDSATRARYLDGDWDAFKAKNAFAHAFNEVKHTADVRIDDDFPLHISFDFNHSPVTCTIWQHGEDKEWIRCLYELGSNESLYDLCRQIRDLIGWNGEELDRIAYITGDRSGWNKTELIEGNRTAYDVITVELGLTKYQVETPKINPNLLKSRELVNGILENHPDILIDSIHCPRLIFDLKFVESDDKHAIIKDRNKTPGKADFLDTMRYYFNSYHEKFIRL